MALNLWQPYNHSLVAPWRRGAFWTDPFEQALDRLFDDSMNIQLRDHAAQLKVDEQGNLTYKVDVSGFRPEELNVEVKGNEIVVRGEHREQNQGESVHRHFMRRVVIPEGIKKESIKSELENGRLCICAQRGQQKGDGPIPIEIKKGTQLPAGEQKQPQQKIRG